MEWRAVVLLFWAECRMYFKPKEPELKENENKQTI